ncbi:MAG: PorT family protein [Bacteroidetes bacterium]|nr:PorT family protein [Bacteroidota bacterium]
MKRTLFMIVPVVLGLMVANADAQSSKIGVTGGWNISSLNGISKTSTRSGLIIGGFVEYDLAPGLALQPEVLFSMKGGSTTSQPPLLTQTGTVPSKYDLTLNYVEVPVLLKLTVFSIPILPADIDLFAGPDFAFNVASKEKNTFAGLSTTINESKDTRPFDFNITVGGGPNLNLGLLTLGVEARYTFATSPVFKNQTVSGVFGNARNGVWSIMASVGF